MLKYIFDKRRPTCYIGLFILGWIAFVAGVRIDHPCGLKLVLLSLARITPQALHLIQLGLHKNGTIKLPLQIKSTQFDF